MLQLIDNPENDKSLIRLNHKISAYNALADGHQDTLLQHMLLLEIKTLAEALEHEDILLNIIGELDSPDKPLLPGLPLILDNVLIQGQ